MSTILLDDLEKLSAVSFYVHELMKRAKHCIFYFLSASSSCWLFDVWNHLLIDILHVCARSWIRTLTWTRMNLVLFIKI